MFIKIADELYNSHDLPMTNLEILAFINDKLRTNNLVPIQVLFDGNVINTDYEDYLLNQLVKIESIEVITLTRKQLFNDMLDSARSYLERSMPEIQNLVDEFYAGPNSETWSRFEKLIEGIEWLISFVQEIEVQGIELSSGAESDYIHRLNTIIKELEEAVKSIDIIQIGDIIQYEIHELFLDLQQWLQKILFKR